MSPWGSGDQALSQQGSQSLAQPWGSQDLSQVQPVRTSREPPALAPLPSHELGAHVAAAAIAAVTGGAAAAGTAAAAAAQPSGAPQLQRRSPSPYRAPSGQARGAAALLEAAARGDLDGIRRQLAQGVGVNETAGGNQVGGGHCQE